jgi:acetyl esterase/lipase
VGVCTLAAVTPARHPSSLARLSWALGMVPNELPFIVFYYLAAVTLVAGLQGDLETSIGRMALALAILATIGLAIIVAWATQTSRAVSDALGESLGIEPVRRRLPIFRILLAPFSVARHDVRRIADIAYGDAGDQQTLDLYRHRDRAPIGPMLVYFHGGGFRTGRKNREARPLIYRLAHQGWLCVSANYRLAPATFSDRMTDVRSVVAWARTCAREHGIDEHDLFVAGSSAGGHLAMTAALTDPSIAGGISLYGYYGPSEAEQRDTSPVAYVRPSSPPLFVAHGDNDTFVPVEAARGFVDEVRSVSTSPVVYAELPGGQHSFDLFHSIRFEKVIDGIEAFTTWVREHHAAEA